MKFKTVGNTSEKFLFEDFWKKDLAGVTPLFSLIYLYAVRCAFSGKSPSFRELADKFSSSETDIEEALLFWSEKGALLFDKGKALAVFTAEETNPKAEFLEKDVSKACTEGKSGYMLTCEKKLGRPLSLTEIEIFSNMRDWIGLDEDVIFTLIDYCKAKGKARIKYMEKVALDWHEKGIASQDAALEYIHMMEYEFTDILKALGKTGFSPTKTDEKYFTKWLKEMEMPLDIVLAACEKTVETTGKPGLKYADKILENWKSEGVKTKDDIERLDAIFKESKEKPGNNPPKKNYAGGGKNRFVNFPQRQWNFDEIANGEEKRHKNNS